MMDDTEEFATDLLKKVNEALKIGVDVNKLQESGHTLLHDAAIYDDLAHIMLLK